MYLMKLILTLIFSYARVSVIPLKSLDGSYLFIWPVGADFTAQFIGREWRLSNCLSGSHGPALAEWALLMAFSTEEWISGLPSEDINTGISSALMLCELPWFFFPASFKSTLSLWHEQEEL